MRTPERSLAWALGLLVALSGCGYNTIQAADEAVKAAWGEVQNQYQRRMDLIPNLVATVKGAADFEKETLEAVVKARASATQVKMDPSVIDDPEALKKIQESQSQLGAALGRLLVVSERYPQLTATAGFRDLQAQLEGTENRITVARKRFVDSVQEYNKLVRSFPTNLTARFLLNAQVRPSFEAATGAEKPPEVRF
jgi:LemA protein